MFLNRWKILSVKIQFRGYHGNIDKFIRSKINQQCYQYHLETSLNTKYFISTNTKCAIHLIVQLKLLTLFFLYIKCYHLNSLYHKMVRYMWWHFSWFSVFRIIFATHCIFMRLTLSRTSQNMVECVAWFEMISTWHVQKKVCSNSSVSADIILNCITTYRVTFTDEF